MTSQSTNTTPDRATDNQPTVNEQLDEMLDNLLDGTDAKLTEIGYERYGENVDEAKQAIISLTKELVAEAKPELPALFAGLSDIGVIMYKKGTDEFEQNLLKALSSSGRAE